MLTTHGTIASAEVLHQPHSSLAEFASVEVLHKPQSLDANSSALPPDTMEYVRPDAI